MEELAIDCRLTGVAEMRASRGRKQRGEIRLSILDVGMPKMLLSSRRPREKGDCMNQSGFDRV